MTDGTEPWNWKDRVTTLAARAQQLRSERHKVPNDLTSAQCQNKRIMGRARGVAEADKVQILVMKGAMTATAVAAASSGGPSVSGDASESKPAAASAPRGDDVPSDADL